jgi:hypothetical protein
MSRNTNALTEGKKGAIGITTRTMQRVTYSTYPSLRNTVGAPGEKNAS